MGGLDDRNQHLNELAAIGVESQGLVATQCSPSRRSISVEVLGRLM
jgi:hypothetical protein